MLPPMTHPETLQGKGLRKKFLPPEAIVDLIEGTRWADSFSHAEVKTLSKYTHAYEAAEGARLVKEGSREAYLCLILEGKAQILKEKSFDGTESARITQVSPGQAIGEISLLDNQPRSASVVAAEPVLFLVMEQDDLDRLTDAVPRLAMKVLREIATILCQRLRQTSGQLVRNLDTFTG